MTPRNINEAPYIAALFADGVVAYQTQDTISGDTLLPEEQQYLLRAVPKRVQEFAAGRACARAGLVKLGFPAVALPVGADRAPVWPQGVTGSITHTKGFCAAAVAPTSRLRALGMDVEPSGSVQPHLWRRICTAQELQWLEQQDPTPAQSHATLIFSAKEAFYKCQHFLTREWLGFTDIRINIESDRFSVWPTRPLQIEAQSAGPWYGRYLSYEGLIITGICIV